MSRGKDSVIALTRFNRGGTWDTKTMRSLVCFIFGGKGNPKSRLSYSNYCCPNSGGWQDVSSPPNDKGTRYSLPHS